VLLLVQVALSLPVQVAAAAAAAAAAGKVSQFRADLSLFGNVRMPCECILPFLVSPVYLHYANVVKQALASVAGVRTVQQHPRGAIAPRQRLPC
jgi:hypothetical protein